MEEVISVMRSHVRTSTVMELSEELFSFFENLGPDNLGQAVCKSLKRIQNKFILDKVLLLDLNLDETQLLYNSFGESGLDAEHKYKGSSKMLANLCEQFSKNTITKISSLAKLPKVAVYERELLKSLGINSFLMVPVSSKRRRYGFMCYSKKEKIWDDLFIKELSFYIRFLINQLELSQYIEKVKESELKTKTIARVLFFLSEK